MTATLGKPSAAVDDARSRLLEAYDDTNAKMKVGSEVISFIFVFCFDLFRGMIAYSLQYSNAMFITLW